MAAGLHLQPRDIHLLASIGELGLLDTETIHERFFPARAGDGSNNVCVSTTNRASPAS